MRILLVEDDHVSRKVLSLMLAPFGEVDTAIDGSEAVGKFTSSRKAGIPYDLICLDVMMPGMDGREVLREIRRLEEQEGHTTLTGVKIVMVTALASYDNIAGAFRDQCDGYLTKPVTKKQLETTLATLGFKPSPT